MADPRAAATLGEACQNPDGTFNGLKLMSWLSEALNPGKGLAVEEVAEIVKEAQAKHDIS